MENESRASNLTLSTLKQIFRGPHEFSEKLKIEEFVFQGCYVVFERENPNCKYEEHCAS